MTMKASISAILLIAVVVISGCSPKPSALTISILTVVKMDSGSLEFEERQGRIMVSVTDKSGDCHVHLLNHAGMTKADALAVLEAKQGELKRNPKGLHGMSRQRRP